MVCVRAKIKEGNEMENGGKVSGCQENLCVSERRSVMSNSLRPSGL